MSLYIFLFIINKNVLTSLYEAYNEAIHMEDGTISVDFNVPYKIMNGMLLWEMDKVIYPVRRIYRGHERSGFIEGVKVGVLL